MFTAETVAQRSGTVVAKQALMNSPQSILRRSVPVASGEVFCMTVDSLNHIGTVFGHEVLS